jgi:hypothetical protein
MERFIKDQDFFGHPVMLSFNKRGNTHQTKCGGIASIFIKIFMLFYIGYNFGKLIFRLEDNFSSVLCGTVSMIPDVKINTVKPIAIILRKSRERTPMRYDSEVKKHIRITWSQYKWDYSTNPPTIEDTRREVRPCTFEDFNQTLRTQEYIKSLIDMDYELLCPDSLDDVTA